MHRFQAIEGARGWLAWMVVLSHVGQILALDAHGGHAVWLARLGETGVMTFIVISGFVITNLVMEKQEPYPLYLLRRAFRIFPAYWVAYAVALAIFPVVIASARLLPLAGDAHDPWMGLITQWQTALATHTALMVWSHVVLLQGLIPDSVIPWAASNVLGPAWSLTLEWQFYLIAPLMIWGLAKKAWRAPTIILIAVGAFIARNNLIGVYYLPSVLPAAAYVFMIGIGCRLAFDELKKAALPPETLLAALVLGLLFPNLLWLAIWLAIYTYLLNSERWSSHPVHHIMRAALDSQFARYCGARSYSVYLFHLPILELVTWWLAVHFHPQLTPFALMLFAIAAPIILLVSDISYRLVERPCIRLGARLTRPRPPVVA
ncbi:MAG TPA: acyltransferase [Vitreimonas sp.]|nr:acyltransferase [Vitreimonas sp.]